MNPWTVFWATQASVRLRRRLAERSFTVPPFEQWAGMQALPDFLAVDEVVPTVSPLLSGQAGLPDESR